MYFIIIENDGKIPAQNEKIALAVYFRACAFYGSKKVKIVFESKEV